MDGVEAELVEDLARELKSRVEWRVGPESELLAELEEFRLDLVVGGLTRSNPWGRRVAFAGPYHTHPRTGERHVLAAPPGENRWLVRIERFLRAQRDRVPALLARAGAGEKP